VTEEDMGKRGVMQHDAGLRDGLRRRVLQRLAKPR